MDKQPSIPQCAICGTTEQLLRCAKCKMVYYCSKGHQHMDWPSHREECRLLARQKNNNKVQLQQTHQSQQQQHHHHHHHHQHQKQQTIVCNTLEVGGAGTSANCSTAQMMTPATLTQSWPDEVDNLLSYIDITSSSPSIESNSNYGSNQYTPNVKMIQEIPGYPATQPTASGTHNNSHHNEKSSSYQMGGADSSFLGAGNERRYEDLCRNIISDMNEYGLSVVDDFLGMERGLKILNEVCSMYNAGAFHDGQLVQNVRPESQSTVRGDKIRGDKIKWVGGHEPECTNVGYLTNQIDSVVYRVNTMMENGILGNYHIRERTRAMVACYPGSGTHYVMHVDNPNKDGRVITAIYYLNINWNTQESGGILRIRPTPGNTVADIEPKFDRLIFFWSDIRNPHEVQPAHRTRYAITVWYFDAKEREEALNRAKQENSNTITSTTTANNTNRPPLVQHTEPDSTTAAATAAATAASTTPSLTTVATSKALTPASMSTGNTAAFNAANVSSSSCAANSEICT